MNVWIGLNDKETVGNWIWVNGERAAVPAAVLWIAGQPNRFGENEDRGEIPAGKFCKELCGMVMKDIYFKINFIKFPI